MPRFVSFCSLNARRRRNMPWRKLKHFKPRACHAATSFPSLSFGSRHWPNTFNMLWHTGKILSLCVIFFLLLFVVLKGTAQVRTREKHWLEEMFLLESSPDPAAADQDLDALQWEIWGVQIRLKDGKLDLYCYEQKAMQLE